MKHVEFVFNEVHCNPTKWVFKHKHFQRGKPQESEEVVTQGYVISISKIGVIRRHFFHVEPRDVRQFQTHTYTSKREWNTVCDERDVRTCTQHAVIQLVINMLLYFVFQYKCEHMSYVWLWRSQHAA